MTSLKLWHEGRLVATVNTDSDLGKAHFRSVSSDAQFLSPRQFKVYRQDDGWCLEHALDATNETLCDGMPVASPVKLATGMTLSVGNSRKGISLFPLKVELETPAADLVETVREAPKIVSDDPSSVTEERPETSSRVYEEEIEPLEPMPTAEVHDRARTPDKTHHTSMNWADIAWGVLGGVVDAIGSAGSNHASIHEGRSTSGPVILVVKDNKVYRGNSTFNEVLLTIDDQRIYRGTSTFLGEVLAHVEGDKVIKGSNTFFTDVVARIKGNQVIAGDSLWGDVIATVENGGRMAAAAAAVYLLLM